MNDDERHERMVTIDDDERGVSSPVGYILDLGIMLTVMSGVTIAGAEFTSSQTDINIENRLEGNGQDLATVIQQVDRDNRSSASTGPIGRTIDLPERAASSYYTIDVLNRSDADADDEYCDEANGVRGCLVLETNSGRVDSVVYFTTGEEIMTKRNIEGGSLYVYMHRGEDKIAVQVV